MTRLLTAVVLSLCASAALAQAQATPGGSATSKPALGELQIRYAIVHQMTNILNDKMMNDTIALMKRAKKAGYTGMYMVDSKLSKYSLQPEQYAQNWRKVREAFTAEGMQLMIPCCSLGYAAEFLAQDPNLAEGMPVRKAPFIVKDGKLVPDDDVALVNGSLTEWDGKKLKGWEIDRPGVVSFKDDENKFKGQSTLRQEGAEPAKGKASRVWQTVKVQPWRYYHLSVAIMTENCYSKDFRIFALGKDGKEGSGALCWEPPKIHETTKGKPNKWLPDEWLRYDVCFPTLENTEIAIYIGTYNTRAGKVWYSDVKLEPAGFVNVIRRDDLPLTVTSEDGKTTYAEGKDFSQIKDPMLGKDPSPGYFTFWHKQVTVTIPAGSSLKDGQKVLVSYHFATPAGKADQIACCMSEPKVYELFQKQVEWEKKNIDPDLYFVSCDEIRHANWDDACTKRNMTSGQILAESLGKCMAIVAKTDPTKQVCTWNDMIDPNHNARKGEASYLARGKDGPWVGSWEGLPSNAMVFNWAQNDAKSLQFFAGRGNPQILAGYYDEDPDKLTPWLEKAAQVKGVCGIMYTTWRGDYSKLEQFLQIAKDFKPQKAEK